MPIFDPTSETLVQAWNQTLTNRIFLKLITPGQAEDPQFLNFSNQITTAASNLTITRERGADRGFGTPLPGFQLSGNLTYSALPLGRELEPFLEALAQLDTHPGPTNPILSNPIRAALDQIDVPVRLKLYIALECPHCPHVVRTIVPLAHASSNIDLHIIDGSLFPETAQSDAVLSAPCLILDDDFRWTGSIQALEVLEMIARRDPSILSRDTLKTILEDGDAAWITRKMIEKRKIFNGFIELMLHETWSARLGAMVVVEELSEADPELAVSLCPHLIRQFDSKDTTIQGDILYALGEAGDSKTRDWIIKKLPDLVHEDLIDAAEEALDTLEQKGR